LCVSPLLPSLANVPKPRDGICTPLLRVRIGPVVAGAAMMVVAYDMCGTVCCDDGGGVLLLQGVSSIVTRWYKVKKVVNE